MLGTKISKNFAWELDCLRFIRNFSDGITFFDFYIDSDFWKGDHNPSFDVMLVILNLKIFQFEIYNIHHEKIND